MKPSSLKVLQGTQRPGRVNPAEPKPMAIPLNQRPPAWLSDRGRRAWREILPILRRMGVVTVADPLALSMLADAVGEYIEARTVVIAEGATYWTEGQSRMLRPRPEVAIASDAWRRAKQLLTEFGLTPASRGRVSGSPEKAEDPLEAWMRNKA